MRIDGHTCKDSEALLFEQPVVNTHASVPSRIPTTPSTTNTAHATLRHGSHLKLVKEQTITTLTQDVARVIHTGVFESSGQDAMQMVDLWQELGVTVHK
eukprot:1160400-Pelagomonas_calceolata.AAC.7